MAKKKTKRRKPEPWVTVNDGYSVQFTFSDRLEKEPETLRRLAHRTMDLLIDAGHAHWLAGSLAVDLAHVADDLVVNHMTKLIHEAHAEGKRAPCAIP